jgi:hypothetical protein
MKCVVLVELLVVAVESTASFLPWCCDFWLAQLAGGPCVLVFSLGPSAGAVANW